MRKTTKEAKDEAKVELIEKAHNELIQRVEYILGYESTLNDFHELINRKLTRIMDNKFQRRDLK